MCAPSVIAAALAGMNRRDALHFARDLVLVAGAAVIRQQREDRNHGRNDQPRLKAAPLTAAESLAVRIPALGWIVTSRQGHWKT